MVYRVIGLMSGSSLDGLDIVFTEFHENGGKWTYQILQADCYSYPDEWVNKLQSAIGLSALDYQLLHTEYGHYLGQQVNKFIDVHGLEYKVALVASHGHTTFHIPGRKMTAQLGDGAAIAAETKLPVVSDLRALDVAFGGQGAPIVPIGEKLLLGNYLYFLNIGGIANISCNSEKYLAFDICPANRVLNLLVEELGHAFDRDGNIAATGQINKELLNNLDALAYYKERHPKSLANDFGTDVVFPLIKKAGISTEDGLRTYVEHIAVQVTQSIRGLQDPAPSKDPAPAQILCTGGGALNKFLVERLTSQLSAVNVEVVVPDTNLVNYKEALIMGLIGVLRWREKYNVFASVTGAQRDSVGGALWMGGEE